MWNVLPFLSLIMWQLVMSRTDPSSSSSSTLPYCNFKKENTCCKLIFLKQWQYLNTMTLYLKLHWGRKNSTHLIALTRSWLWNNQMLPVIIRSWNHHGLEQWEVKHYCSSKETMVACDWVQTYNSKASLNYESTAQTTVPIF